MVSWSDDDKVCPRCGKKFRLLTPLHPWWWDDRPHCSAMCRDAQADTDLTAILRGKSVADEQDNEYAGA